MKLIWVLKTAGKDLLTKMKCSQGARFVVMFCRVTCVVFCLLLCALRKFAKRTETSQTVLLSMRLPFARNLLGADLNMGGTLLVPIHWTWQGVEVSGSEKSETPTQIGQTNVPTSELHWIVLWDKQKTREERFHQQNLHLFLPLQLRGCGPKDTSTLPSTSSWRTWRSWAMTSFLLTSVTQPFQKPVMWPISRQLQHQGHNNFFSGSLCHYGNFFLLSICGQIRNFQWEFSGSHWNFQVMDS